MNPVKTAIFIVHGMGQQQPFETLGVFAQNLQGILPELKGRPEPELIDQEGWHQSCLRMRVDQEKTIDIYEYYWAPFTEGKITLKATCWWLIRSVMAPYLYLADWFRLSPQERGKQKRVRSEALRLGFFLIVFVLLMSVGVTSFWAGKWVLDQKALLGSIKEADFATQVLTAMGVMHTSLIVISLWTLFSALVSWVRRSTQQSRALGRFKALSGLIMVTLILVGGFSVFFPWYGPIFKKMFFPAMMAVGAYLAYRSIRWVMIQYIGDNAIYFSSNALSDHYEVRKKILDGSVEMLENILQYPPEEIKDREIEGGYDQVIIIAHSLGSVIAYDTLNRLLVRNTLMAMNKKKTPVKIDKVRLLVTMGSPLEKVYYLFRERIPECEWIRKEITDSLYPLVNGTNHDLRKVKWLNFWTLNDPVSDRLSHYPVNINYERFYRVPILAHLFYWKDPLIYEEISKFITSVSSASVNEESLILR